ncbi:MAG: hypothetical protein V3S01_07015 [Dehalococcoidia bacterium]
MPLNDDTDVLYEKTRREEVALERDAENLAAMQRHVERSAQLAGVPAPTPAESADPAEDESVPWLPSPGEAGLAAVKGVLAQPAKLGDFVMQEVARPALEAAGLTGLAATLGQERVGGGAPSGDLEDAVDSIDSGDSVGAAAIEGISEFATLMATGGVALRGAGIVASGFRGAGIVNSGAASAVAAGTLGFQGNPNVSEVAITQGEGTVFDNAVTRFLATDDDDSTALRIFKSVIEDVPLGLLGEGVVRGAVAAGKGAPAAVSRIVEGLGKARVAAKERRAHRAVAAEEGVLDEGVEAAVDEVLATRTEADVADHVADLVDEAGADFEAASAKRALDEEVGEFTGAEDVLPEVEPVAIDADDLDAIMAAREQTAGARDQAEANMIDAIAGSDLPPQAIESTRQTLAAHNPNPAIDEALARIITERQVALPTEAPKQGIFGNHLRLDDVDIAAIRAKVEAGDFDGAARAAGDIYDSTNYNHMSTDEGINDTIAGVIQMLGGSKLSKARTGTVTHAQTEDAAIREIVTVSASVGGNVDAIIANLRTRLPGSDMLEVWNAYRFLEVALVEQGNTLMTRIKAAHAANGSDTAAKAHWAQLALQAANLSDHRRGLASEFGRVLNSQKIDAHKGGMDEFLSAGRELRGKQIQDVIQTAGGEKHLDKLIETVDRAQGPDAIRHAMIQAAINQAPSFFDTLFNWSVINQLSAGATQGINIGTSAARVLSLDPLSDLFGAALSKVLRRDPAPFWKWRKVTAARYANFKDAIMFDGSTRAGVALSPRERQLSAFREGIRQTGTNAGGSNKFTEVNEATLLGPGPLGRMFRANVPLDIPLVNVRVGMAKVVPGGERLSQKIADKLAPIGADEANPLKLKYGPGARVLDHASSIHAWPTKLLATGDEINAGVAKSAAIQAEAQDVILRGTDMARTDPAGAEAKIWELTHQAPLWRQLAREGDLTDPDFLAHIEQLKALDEAGDRYVEKATFTEPPGPITQAFLAARRAIPGLRFITPYARIPAILARQGIRDFTPLGPMADLAFRRKTMTRVQIEAAQGKLAFTTAFATTVFGWMAAGKITGSGPLPGPERDMWLADGNVPYSSQVPFGEELGIQPFTFNRLDPMAIPVQIVAELADAATYMKEEEYEGFTAEFVARTSAMLQSKAFAEGLGDLVAILDDPVKNMTKLAVDVATNVVVPWSSLSRQLRREGIPVLGDIVEAGQHPDDELTSLEQFLKGDRRKTLKNTEHAMWNLSDSIQAVLPAGFVEDGYGDLMQRLFSSKESARLVSQTDYWGDVSVAPPTWGPDYLSSISADPGESDPVKAEMLAQGVNFSHRIFDEIKGFKLSNPQRAEFNKLFSRPKGGVVIYDRMATKMASPNYLAAGSTVRERPGEGFRATQLRQIHSQRMSEAEREMIKRHPKTIGAHIKQVESDKHDQLRADDSEALQEEVRGNRNRLHNLYLDLRGKK